MSASKFFSWIALSAAYAFLLSITAFADTSILNVSYDVSRELYKDVNAAFAASWKAKSGATITINQSHGGSSKQALSVISGLEADVVTMNQAPDIDILVERGGLVDSGLAQALCARRQPVHHDLGVPRAQGQPEGDQGLG